jgi:hypothetical protein
LKDKGAIFNPRSAKNKRLCEKCHEQPATCFTCNGNTAESQDLCETCYQKTASQEELAFHNQLKEAIRNGKCRHCGEPAAGGYAGFTMPDSEKPEFNFECKHCSHDLREFYKVPENNLPVVVPLFNDPKAMKQRLKQHREIGRRLKEFLKQRITERKSRGKS